MSLTKGFLKVGSYGCALVFGSGEIYCDYMSDGGLSYLDIFKFFILGGIIAALLRWIFS